MLADVKHLNIHWQVDVKLIKLAKQMLLLLPLLLLLCITVHVVINGANVWIAPLEMDSPGARPRRRRRL